MLILALVRLRIALDIVFVCPQCGSKIQGRRCYLCRLEADPDDTPSEMGLFEFISWYLREQYVTRFKKQNPVNWSSF